MFSDFKDTATDDADWAVTINLINDETNSEWFEAASMAFHLGVKDGNSFVLSATTDDGSITRPEDHQIAWRFTSSQMAALCSPKTFTVGCVYEKDGEVTQLFLGTLTVLDGGIA